MPMNRLMIAVREYKMLLAAFLFLVLFLGDVPIEENYEPIDYSHQREYFRLLEEDSQVYWEDNEELIEDYFKRETNE